MMLAPKPLACLILFSLPLILFLLTSHEKHNIPSGNSPHYTIHAHFHPHHQLQQQQQQVIEQRLSSIKAPASTICRGRRIYIHKLPPQFNSDLLQQCGYGLTTWLNFCAHIVHHGLGKPLHLQELALTDDDQGSTPSLSANDSFLQFSDKKSQNTIRKKLLGEPGAKDKTNSGQALHCRHFEWHRTDAYMLEVIFHHRLLQYPCLTDNPEMADAFFLPYYTGLDALKYLYGEWKGNPKAQHGSNLVAWLQQDAIAKQAWKKYRGQDHILIMSRTPWDFGNLGSKQWGTGILQIPEYANMTLLLFEKQQWRPNQHAIPYPTSFHPTSPSSLHAWMKRVRNNERTTLFTFAGSVRPELMKGGIRDMLIDQCLSSKAYCKLLDCKELKCSHNPEPIIRAFLQSQFCLQPRGDTPTRRSLFDAIIAGCIPVIFHNDTAYTQYEWHLPKEASKWSVYIDEGEIRKGVLVEETLLKYTKENMRQMREVLIGLIPKVVYAGYSFKQGEADAFDVSVREMLKLVSHKKSKLTKLQKFVEKKKGPN
ncbi:hypothetical protein L7F22_047494 [Adiantum nelumboides]|nr:hypothetical protein [Adiantum nelumboides]